MTERMHPNEQQAYALVGDERFCEWLDATSALACGWPHSRFSARRWLEARCGVESLGHLAIDADAAAAFQEVAHHFALWDRNEELAV